MSIAFKILLSTLFLIVVAAYVTAPMWIGTEVAKRLDITALALLMLVLLPWILPHVAEFEVFGFKARLREVARRTDEALKDAQEAQSAAADARAAAESASRESARAEQLAIHADEAAKTATSAALAASSAALDARQLTEDLFQSNSRGIGGAAKTIEELAEEYVATRKEQERGPARTARLTELFAQMQKAAKIAGPSYVSTSEWLARGTGHQLAAIAYMRTFPEEADPGALISLVEMQKQPFIQYWALRVLSEVMREGGLSSEDLGRIRALECRVKTGTDRHRLLSEIVSRVDGLSGWWSSA